MNIVSERAELVKRQLVIHKEMLRGRGKREWEEGKGKRLILARSPLTPVTPLPCVDLRNQVSTPAAGCQRLNFATANQVQQSHPNGNAVGDLLGN